MEHFHVFWAHVEVGYTNRGPDCLPVLEEGSPYRSGSGYRREPQAHGVSYDDNNIDLFLLSVITCLLHYALPLKTLYFFALISFLNLISFCVSLVGQFFQDRVCCPLTRFFILICSKMCKMEA